MWTYADSQQSFLPLTPVWVCLWSSCYWPPVCVHVWGHLVTDLPCVIVLVVILVLTSCVYFYGHLVLLSVRWLHSCALSDLRSLSLAPEPRCSSHPAVSLVTVSGFAASDPEEETNRERDVGWWTPWGGVSVCLSVWFACVPAAGPSFVCVCVFRSEGPRSAACVSGWPVSPTQCAAGSALPSACLHTQLEDTLDQTCRMRCVQSCSTLVGGTRWCCCAKCNT